MSVLNTWESNVLQNCDRTNLYTPEKFYYNFSTITKDCFGQFFSVYEFSNLKYSRKLHVVDAEQFVVKPIRTNYSKCFCSFKIADKESYPCSRTHQVKNNEMN